MLKRSTSVQIISYPVHWFNEGTCHAAVVAGSVVLDEGMIVSADILQLGPANTLHNGVMLNESSPYPDNTWHFPPECTTD